MKKPKAPNKKKTGRPLEYNPKYCRIAKSLCLLGATNEKLAEAFGVHKSTISEWMVSKPAFSDAVKEGREFADAAVADALYNRAIGFKHQASKLQLHRDGTWKSVQYTEVYPPDPTSMLFWLKNRKPDQWREKLDIEQKTIVVKVPGEKDEEE